MDKFVDRLHVWHHEIAFIGAAFVLSVAVVSWYWREDRPYRGFRLIGQEHGEWSFEKARLRWNTDAMELLRDGFEEVCRSS